MTIAIILILFFIFVFVYRRYVPAAKISNMPCNTLLYKNSDLICVDTRDYQLSFRDPIDGAYRLPISYLKRYIDEIPSDKQIVIIASDFADRNLGARFLRQKGKQVTGYYLIKNS